MQVTAAVVVWVLLIGMVHSAQESQAATLAFQNVKFSSNVFKSMLQENESSSEEAKSSIFGGKGKLSCLACDSGHCADGVDNSTQVHEHICRNATQCYVAIIRDTDGIIHQSKGCARDFQQEAFYCSTDNYDGRHVHKLNQVSAQYAFNCCKDNMCNENASWPTLPFVPVVESNPESENKDVTSKMLSSNGATVRLVMDVAGPALLLILVVIVILLVMHRRHKKRMAELSRANRLDYSNDEEELIGLRARPTGDSTLREFRAMDGSITSGSGSGMPLHQRRTVAREIKLERCIGKGRYGEVRLGLYKGDLVAVKMFPSREESSFRREVEIYETSLLDHANILRYIAADTTSVNSYTEFWLVTHYHKNGSLYEYLTRPKSFIIDLQASLRLLYTALCGIDHLHLSISTTQVQSESSATQNKVAIAHRDIKSKNILVRSDGSCVIADFGLALLQNRDTQKSLSEKEVRVGTKRYMSPEILDLSIMKRGTQFESFLRSDIYSFSLVMWEVLRRTDLGVDGPAAGHALPYHQNVGADPDYDEMREVVCENEIRPELDERWEKLPIAREISQCMSECWNPNPSARLSAIRAKNLIGSLLSRHSVEERDTQFQGEWP